MTQRLGGDKAAASAPSPPLRRRGARTKRPFSNASLGWTAWMEQCLASARPRLPWCSALRHIAAPLPMRATHQRLWLAGRARPWLWRNPRYGAEKIEVM